MSDHFGRRRTLLVGLAIFVVGAVACALASSAGVLIVHRLSDSSRLFVVSDSGPIHHRGRLGVHPSEFGWLMVSRRNPCGESPRGPSRG